MGNTRPSNLSTGRAAEGFLLGGLGVLGFSFTLPATRTAVAQLDGTVVGLVGSLAAPLPLESRARMGTRRA